MESKHNRSGRLNASAWIVVSDQDMAIALANYLHRHKRDIQQKTYVDVSEALERAVIEAAPDVLVTRFSVQEHAGTRDFLHKLRGIPKFARVPCVVLTCADEIDSEGCNALAQLGVVDCYGLPADGDPALAERIDQICKEGG